MENTAEKRKLLVVVDMSNEFITGALGSKEAVKAVPKAAKKIKEWEGDIAVLRDTHFANYLETREGKNLPVPHGLEGTPGYALHPEIAAALADKILEKCKVKVFIKYTFASTELAQWVAAEGYDEVEFIGQCTDICVISNILCTKAFAWEADIAVDAECCSGTTPEKHEEALDVMLSCQVIVKNRS